MTQNNNEVFYINSGLLPCIEVGMYESPLDPRHFEEHIEDIEHEDGDEFYVCNVNYSDWKKELTKVANNWLQSNVIGVLRDYGVISMEGTGIWSPKYYNYHTDQLEMTIVMAENWRDIMAEKVASWRGRQDITDYIRNHWHSCSGFISFMPTDLEAILKESDDDRQLASYLTLALLVEDSLDESEDGSRSLWELAEIMDEQFCDYDSINVPEEYMSDSDVFDLMELWRDDLRWNELYWSLVEKVGFIWLHDNNIDASELPSKKVAGYSFRADSDGKKLLFWAIQKDITVKDLYDMAA